jgi:RNA polymerase sigma factor (sigma-70 family)
MGVGNCAFSTLLEWVAPRNRRQPRDTLLGQAIRALGLRQTTIVRMANQLADALGIPSISRSQLGRLMRGQTRATDESIAIIVAACSELSGVPLHPGDLFPLQVSALRLAVASYGRGRQLAVPLSSAGNSTREAWRELVTEETTGPEDIQQLYVEHGVIMRAVAMRRYRIPPDDAEDIVHDALVDLLQRPTPPTNARGWLLGNVKHRCKHFWRDRKREAPLLPEHDETIDTASESTLEVWERRLTVSAMLARIGPKCRETLRGFYLAEETNDALASRLRKAPAYIYVLLSTCRRRLSELFRATRSRTR